MNTLDLDLKNLPVKDPFIQQVLNYVIVDSYLKHGYEYRNVAQDRIKKYGINVSFQYLTNIKTSLLNGSRPLLFPTIFTGKLQSRYGKDAMYHRFFGLLNGILCDKTQRHYIGLTAEQIGMYLPEMNGSITSCELDPQRYKWIRSVHYLFGQFQMKTNFPVEIKQENVFKCLATGQGKYNVIDLDLMCYINNVSELTKWSMAIHNGAQKLCVVNLATCIGRVGPTELEYQAMIHGGLQKCFEVAGFKKVTICARDKYADSTPMRWEHIILEK